MAEPRTPIVLVIEDSDAKRYALVRPLQRAGFTVWEANTAAEGLHLAHNNPDVIVLDIKLPDELGFAVCQKLKRARDTASIPVLHVSASFTTTADKIYGLESGADGYLVEPVRAEEFVAHVKVLLRLKQAQDALRESEERFRTLAENIPQLAWMSHPDGGIFWYNQRWFDYTGSTLEEMQGWGWQKAQHPDHLERVTASYKRAIASGEPWEDTFPLRRHDGTYRWFLSRAFPIRDNHGTLTRWFGTNTDITELREMHERLQATQNQLELHAGILEQTVEERTAKLRESMQELEAFSYSIAHDMRAPLRAMQGFANIINEEYAGQLDATFRGYLHRIESAAQRMDKFIVDILDYSKVVRAELELRPVNAQQLIEEILTSYPDLQSVGDAVTIDTSIPRVLANEAALTQVIANLLSNAVKFVTPGVKPRVHITAQTVDGWVRLWFEDNGIGIPPQAVGRLFDIFTRINRPGLYEGTGIGLAIVRKAVERMGGQVGVESEPGRGSRFWVQLKPVTTL